MSGIMALFDGSGQPVSPDTVIAMTRPLARRGPDAEGLWVSGEVGLGHRMLWTTPESVREQQPRAEHDVAITADARIDNRVELAREVGWGRSLAETPDSMLLLAAYQKWGTSCTQRILGDYAFAIWDGPNRQLFAARDPFGVRPLYYVREGGGLFACASEIKAILAHPEIHARLNEAWVVDALAGIRDDTEGTIYKGVLRLGPGHQMVVTEDGVKIERHFELLPEEVPPATDQEYGEQFFERFQASVAARSRSAYPVAAHLSGGLDSSAVVGVTRELLAAQGRGPLHTYSLVYDDVASCNEQEYIDIVLDQGGVVPHFIRGDQLGPLENVGEVYSHLDEVLAAGNQHLVWALFKASHLDEAEIRVVLDGLDGDNVVSHGHNRFRELAASGDWETFGREMGRSVERFSSATHRHNFEETLSSRDGIYLSFGQPVLDRLAEEGPLWSFARGAWGAHKHAGVRLDFLRERYGRRALAPSWLLRRRRPSDPPRLAPLVDAEVAQRLRLGERLEAVAARDLKALVGKEDTVRGAQWAVLASPRISYALEGTAHVAGAFGLEVAHPFFDVRLVQFCLGLPSEQSYSDGWTRLVLRRAMAGVLPDEIRWRVGKAWMADNYARGLFIQDGDLLREHLDDLGPLEEFVDRAELERLRVGAESAPNDVQARLGQIATLSIWLKKRFA